MGIRINRSQPLDSENDFNITGTSGENYNLDDIVNGKNRSANSELVANVSETPGTRLGNLGITPTPAYQAAGNGDYVRYLLDNEPTRPVLVNKDNKEESSGSSEVDELRTQILATQCDLDSLRQTFLNKIDKTVDDIDILSLDGFTSTAYNHIKNIARFMGGTYTTTEGEINKTFEGNISLPIIGDNGITISAVNDENDHFIKFSNTSIIPGEAQYSVKQYADRLSTDNANLNRSNVVNGAFSAALGSRNTLDGLSTETITTGGKNKVYTTEDALITGYNNTVSAGHQSIIGGYLNTVQASESIIVGDRNSILGTIDASTYRVDTKQLACFGGQNSIGSGVQWSLISGQSNTLGNYNKWNNIMGGLHNIGDNNECVNTFGYRNTTNAYLTDSTIFGYDNEVYGGHSNNSHSIYDVYMLGNNNTNKSGTKDPTNSFYLGYYGVCEIGRGLKATHNYHTLFGSYNAGDSYEVNDKITIGGGTSSSNRSTIAGIGNDGANNYLRLGHYTLKDSDISYLHTLPTSINTLSTVINDVSSRVTTN